MRKENGTKGLFVLGLGILGAFFATSCTNDEFFGLEEEESVGLEYSSLHEIACSEEFIEYQTQYFLDMEKLFSIDTTQMTITDTLKGRPVYTLKDKGSISKVIEARRLLLESYPEYENTTAVEKEQIFNIALLNDKSLRKLANRIVPDAVSRASKTKSVNYETDAVKYICNKSEIELIDSNNAEWLLQGTISYFTMNTWGESVCKAIDLTVHNEQNVEHGGFGFNDGSGILVVDPNAQRGEMDLGGYWAGDSYLPGLDFHVHPSGITFPSDGDKVVWEQLPWSFHIIYNCWGYYSVYYW